MNAGASWNMAVTLLDAHPLLERLFFASIELAALTIILMALFRVRSVRSARLASLLCLVVLIKPLFSLGFPPLAPIMQLHAAPTPDEPRVATQAQVGAPTPDATLVLAHPALSSSPATPQATAPPLPHRGRLGHTRAREPAPSRTGSSDASPESMVHGHRRHDARCPRGPAATWEAPPYRRQAPG